MQSCNAEANFSIGFGCWRSSIVLSRVSSRTLSIGHRRARNLPCTNVAEVERAEEVLRVFKADGPEHAVPHVANTLADVLIDSRGAERSTPRLRPKAAARFAERLRQATLNHRTGRLAAAEAGYREVLAAVPGPGEPSGSRVLRPAPGRIVRREAIMRR